MNTLLKSDYSTSTLRYASDLFNTTVFKRVVRDGDTDLFNIRAIRLLNSCPYFKAKYTVDLIQKAYSIISDKYRIEYFYKNTILNSLLTQSQFVQDSVVVFNEFKINKSIADVVYINGTNRAYEIKTELDTPERMVGQIADYKKMFSEINIVTHESLYSRYNNILDNDEIGIYVLDEQLKIVNKKMALIDNSKLDVEVMLKTLRKKEIISLIYDITSIHIQISNMYFFDECLLLLKDYDILEVQKLVFKYLKQRGIREKDMLLNPETINELKYICLSLSFSKKEYETLYSFLTLPISR